MKATAPVPTTLSASIVAVNHAGTSMSVKNSSPTMPSSTKAATNPTNQPMAWRTSRKTRAPSGASMPQSPTPPEGRNPPDSIWPIVVSSSTSSSCTVRNGPKARFREKTTNEPTEMPR